MKKNLSNLIIYGNIENGTLFYFRKGLYCYRYVSFALDNLQNNEQKMLVIVYNLNKNKYEILDCSKFEKKEVIIL